MRPQSSLVFLILVVAVLIRLLALLFVTHPEIRDTGIQVSELSDEQQYHNVATAIAFNGRYLHKPGGQPTAERTPGATLPIAGIYVLFGPNLALATIYVLCCSIVCVGFQGLIGRRSCTSSFVMLTAMTLTAALPSLVMFSGGVWSDPVALMWFLAALWLMLRIEDQADGPWDWLMLGLFLALAQLTRPSGGILAILVLTHLLIRGLQRRQLRRVLIAVVAVALPVAMWGARNQVVLGRFLVGSSLQGEALFRCNNAVTAGLATPVRRYLDGYDLQKEAADGLYAGRAVPLEFLLTEVPQFGHGPSELQANDFYQKKTLEFFKHTPYAPLGLVFYKAKRLITAEPLASSILGLTSAQRASRWVFAAGERWFFLGFGAAGLVGLYRRNHRHRIAYTLFLIGSSATVFVSDPSARYLLPFTATLTVPASLSLASIACRIRSRQEHAQKPKS